MFLCGPWATNDYYIFKKYCSKAAVQQQQQELEEEEEEKKEKKEKEVETIYCSQKLKYLLPGFYRQHLPTPATDVKAMSWD